MVYTTPKHELQHLIHAGYEGDKIEDVFINDFSVGNTMWFSTTNPSWYLELGVFKSYS